MKPQRAGRADLLALASQEGRVCPRPSAWLRMYELLPDRRHDGYGAIPAPPLVAGDWDRATDEQKRLRLVEHIDWAAAHGALGGVASCLMALTEGDWHHVGD